MPRQKNSNLLPLKRLTTTGAVVVLGMIIVGYTLWQLRHVIDGPLITLSPIRSEAVLASPLVAITGTAERVDWLFLNNRQIFTDETGHFTESLLLAPGYNILTLAGKDKFGRMITKTIELVYQATSTSETI